MTETQWKALKVGDRIICIYNGRGNGNSKNGCKATVSQVCPFSISVSWDDGSRDLENGWTYSSSFDLLQYDLLLRHDLMNGGVSL
jgi:hypothetical protein